jgi:hypothetical protein
MYASLAAMSLARRWSLAAKVAVMMGIMNTMVIAGVLAYNLSLHNIFLLPVTPLFLL